MRENDKGEHGVLFHQQPILGQVVIGEKAIYGPCFSKLKSPWIVGNNDKVLLPYFRLFDLTSLELGSRTMQFSHIFC